QPIGVVTCPTQLARDVLALDQSSFVEALADGGNEIGCPVGGALREVSDDGRRWHLLRPSRERPRDSRATEERDELAPPDHSITSSARASRVGGTSRRSILAVGWLMTSSNLLACTTGRSAGFSPLRMRPAYLPN